MNIRSTLEEEVVVLKKQTDADIEIVSTT